MSVSKKIRFEVFKRDGFKCQYCGQTPPTVTLELDHINPKSKNGTDDINNLLTACFDCNRGKRDIPLEKIPNTLNNNIEILKEKEMQLREYNKIISKIEKRIHADMQKVDDIYNSYFEKYTLSEKFKNTSLKKFINELPLNEVCEAMEISCSMMIDKNQTYPSYSAIKYFCGICWNKIRGNKNEI